MRAYSTVQQLLCHGGYCELILSLARTSCRLLFTARPTARPLAGNPLRDVVRSTNPSKSTLAHDTVVTAVLHKYHPIIRVGAGLIQFVYRSHLRLATEDTRNRNAFSPFFPRVFRASRCLRVCLYLRYTGCVWAYACVYVRVYVCVRVSVSVCHLEITRVDICLLRSDTYLIMVLIRHNISSHLRSFSG